MHVARVSDDRRLRTDNRKMNNADIVLRVFSERGVVGEWTLEVRVNLGQGEREQVGRQTDRQLEADLKPKRENMAANNYRGGAMTQGCVCR